jgi:hypothetical protein
MRYLCLKLFTLSMPCHPSTIELLRATNPVEFPTMWKTRDPYWSGRISIVDLLAFTCSDLPYVLEIIITSFFTKQAILIRRPTVLSLPRYWSLTWTSLVWLKLWHLLLYINAPAYGETKLAGVEVYLRQDQNLRL